MDIYTWIKNLETCIHYGIKGRSKHYFGFRLEFYPRDLKGNVVYVCGTCFLPFGSQIALSLYDCECGTKFSSPWETVCIKCHRIENSDVSLQDGRVSATLRDDAPPYMDWWWLRDRLREHKLTFSRDRPTQPVGEDEKTEKVFDKPVGFRYVRH